LLARLAARVECSRNLRAAEGAVVEQAAVFAREGHTLRGALINDIDRDFGQAMHVGFAGSEIAAFDRVVKQTMTLSPSFW
jgi:hypothetical protein